MFTFFERFSVSISDVRTRLQLLFCMIRKDTLNKASGQWQGGYGMIYIHAILVYKQRLISNEFGTSQIFEKNKQQD